SARCATRGTRWWATSTRGTRARRPAPSRRCPAASDRSRWRCCCATRWTRRGRSGRDEDEARMKKEGREILSVGLTGGIACGRTTIGATLARLGACVIDMDELAHRLVAPGGAAAPLVASAFGSEYADDRGGIKRKALGALVFHDP